MSRQPVTSSESSLIETQPYSITFTSNLASLFPYSLTLCNPNLASAKKNTMEHNRLLVRYLDSWLPWTVFRMVESSRFLLDRASFTSTSHVNRMSGPPLEKGTTMVFVCPALACSVREKSVTGSRKRVEHRRDSVEMNCCNEEISDLLVTRSLPSLGLIFTSIYH